LEASRFQLRRDEAARIQLDDEPVEPERVAKIRQSLDHLAWRAADHLLRKDVFVGQLRHPFRLRAPGVRGARAADRGARELGLPTEEVGEALARLFDTAFFRPRR